MSSNMSSRRGARRHHPHPRRGSGLPVTVSVDRDVTLVQDRLARLHCFAEHPAGLRDEAGDALGCVAIDQAGKAVPFGRVVDCGSVAWGEEVREGTESQRVSWVRSTHPPHYFDQLIRAAG